MDSLRNWGNATHVKEAASLKGEQIHIERIGVPQF